MATGTADPRSWVFSFLKGIKSCSALVRVFLYDRRQEAFRSHAQFGSWKPSVTILRSCAVRFMEAVRSHSARMYLLPPGERQEPFSTGAHLVLWTRQERTGC